MSRRLVRLVTPTLLSVTPILLSVTVVSLTVILSSAAPAAAAPAVDYVALGDSYSAGVGAAGSTGLCLRSPNGYPQLWDRRNDPASFRSVACAGAETDDVLLWQVPFLRSGTDLVSITIGGNDAGFASAVISCTLGSDSACAQRVATARGYIAATLPGRLDETYRAIRRRAPTAQVVVLSYPRLFDVTAANCGAGGMSLAKRRVLNAGADDLDEVIRARSAAAGFTFADVRDEFDGHGICSAAPWLNGLTVIPPTYSWHPNATGYARGYLPALSGAVD